MLVRVMRVLEDVSNGSEGSVRGVHRPAEDVSTGSEGSRDVSKGYERSRGC